MRKISAMFVIAALSASLLVSGCGGGEEQNLEPEGMEEVLIQFESPQKGTEIATIHTTMGDIEVMFFPDKAPKTVENFITHAKNGYYDGIIFHRVDNGFMIQGGDPEGTGRGGESIWGGKFEDEFSMDLFNFRGALSMANSGANTNGSQFFIVQASDTRGVSLADFARGGWPEAAAKKYTEVGGAYWLDQKHTVFGQVISGMDVVDAIAASEKRPGTERPVEDVVIQSISFRTVE